MDLLQLYSKCYLSIVGCNGRRDVWLGDEEVENVEPLVGELGHAGVEGDQDRLRQVHEPRVVNLRG